MKRTNTSVIVCDTCKINVAADKWYSHIRSNDHKINSAVVVEPGMLCVKNCFKNRIETYILENVNVKGNGQGLETPDEYMDRSRSQIKKILINTLKKHIHIKVQLELFCEYMKFVRATVQGEEDEMMLSIKSFKTKMLMICVEDEIESFIDDAKEAINTEASEFQERDSGWTLTRIIHLEININKYQPLRGSQYIAAEPS